MKVFQDRIISSLFSDIVPFLTPKFYPSVIVDFGVRFFWKRFVRARNCRETSKAVKEENKNQGVVVTTHNPSIWEAKA